MQQIQPVADSDDWSICAAPIVTAYTAYSFCRNVGCWLYNIL